MCVCEFMRRKRKQINVVEMEWNNMVWWDVPSSNRKLFLWETFFEILLLFLWLGCLMLVLRRIFPFVIDY
jgi:hypothetical protein